MLSPGPVEPGREGVGQQGRQVEAPGQGPGPVGGHEGDDVDGANDGGIESAVVSGVDIVWRQRADAVGEQAGEPEGRAEVAAVFGPLDDVDDGAGVDKEAGGRAHDELLPTQGAQVVGVVLIAVDDDGAGEAAAGQHGVEARAQHPTKPGGMTRISHRAP